MVLKEGAQDRQKNKTNKKKQHFKTNENYIIKHFKNK